MNPRQDKPNENSAHMDSSQKPRPPVVVVMGHVDHGKTTLLDFLRKTKIAEGEAGGITQSIGAYEIGKGGRKITFIDTPGHEAFSKMRQRGAKIADLAVLVIAADDGVKPQTKEAIEILKQTETPFVVAINKVDKSGADIERAKRELAENGVLLEKMGGEVPLAVIAAKSGEGIEELLDVLLLVWEMQGLSYNPSAHGRGFVLEAHRDSQRGVTASVIIKDGTLRVSDTIVTPSTCGKVKVLENFLSERVEALEPSSPALVLGFDDVPQVGEEFVAGEFELERRAEFFPAVICEKKKAVATTDKSEETINIVLRADVGGSLEALAHMIEAMEIGGKKTKILSQEVGDITDGDVKTAMPAGAIIIGFNVKVKKEAENMAKSQKVRIITSDIIYRIVEELEKDARAAEIERGGGTLEVLAIFSRQGRKQLVGGRVAQGLLAVGDVFVIKRGEETAGKGRITNLQQNKEDVKKVMKDECGMMIESPEPIAVGDQLVVEG